MSAGRGLEDYVDVAARLAAFDAKYPQGSLTCEILEDDGKRILMRAEALVPIFHESTVVAYRRGVGHAEEIRNQGQVNRTSAVENAETSAWGRALAALGFETKKGVASRQEMEKVERMTQEPAKPTSKPSAAFKKLTPGQVSKIEQRLADADPLKVQLMLAKLGANDLPGLTAEQAKQLLAEIGA